MKPIEFVDFRPEHLPWAVEALRRGGFKTLTDRGMGVGDLVRVLGALLRRCTVVTVVHGGKPSGLIFVGAKPDGVWTAHFSSFPWFPRIAIARGYKKFFGEWLPSRFPGVDLALKFDENGAKVLPALSRRGYLKVA